VTTALPCERVLDVAPQSLLGLVGWRLGLAFSRMSTSVVHRPTECLQDGDAPIANVSVVLRGRGRAKATFEFGDLLVHLRPTCCGTQRDSFGHRRVELGLLVPVKLGLHRVEELPNQVSSWPPRSRRVVFQPVRLEPGEVTPSDQSHAAYG
jgi:hypothetical protein